LIYKLVELFIREDTPERSLFVVGDLKQSIYGFQGAAPHLFESLAGAFAHLMTARRHRFEKLTLEDSFRTTPAILSVVDKLFEHKPEGMGGHVYHSAYRTDKGYVVCHTLEDQELNEPKEIKEKDPQKFQWNIFTNYVKEISPDQDLAASIADDIEKILSSGWIVPSTQKPITEPDILVLLRSRGKLSHLIIQALKKRNIKVEGPDRIYLLKRLAIEDTLALIRFLCLPDDDFSLAHVLKSPFINDGHGFSEEVLFDLCSARTASLWQHMQTHLDQTVQNAVTQLKIWLSWVDYETPYSLLYSIIDPSLSAFENRLGKDSGLLFEAFLDTVLDLEADHPTLSDMLYVIENSMPTVKRDPLKPTGVRIMTIHGSKGLEAPCVLLVDRKERVDLTKENILWPTITDEATGESVSLFCVKPKASLAIDAFKELRLKALEVIHEERNRLLYVALTRARDCLWIVGSGKWIKDIQPFTDAAFMTDVMANGGGLMRSDAISDDVQTKSFPFWIDQIYKEKTSQKITETSQALPINEAAANRGILIHKTLELLSKTSKENQDTIFEMMRLQGLNPDDQNKIKTLIYDPKFSFFFGGEMPDSQSKIIFQGSEVEVISNNKIYRIDRLIETTDALWIIDYKTGLRDQNQGIRKMYIQQLQNYAQAAAFFTLGKPIKTFLLWTDSMEIEEIIF
jgi:ATP-dependent helicase/nuclease subunit A